MQKVLTYARGRMLCPEDINSENKTTAQNYITLKRVPHKKENEKCRTEFDYVDLKKEYRKIHAG